MAMLIGCCSSALAVSMVVERTGDHQNVTFSWGADEKEGTVAGKDITADIATTIDVAAGKDVTVYGTSGKQGCVYGFGGLTKTGEGDLSIRLNDTRRQLDSSNDFGGNVTVEAGTMTLLHDKSGDDSHSAHIGGGKDNQTVVTVKAGSTLYMTENTGIDIPMGDLAEADVYFQIEGADDVGLTSPEGWATALEEGDTNMKGSVKNAVVTVNGITNESSESRAAVRAYSVGMVNKGDSKTLASHNTDFVAMDFTINGHTELDNTRVYSMMLSSSSVSSGSTTVDGYSATIKNHSLLLANYGYITNADIDATSKVQAWSDESYLQLVGKNTLEVLSQEKGVATRVDSQKAYMVGGVAMELTTLTFNTDQVKGCILDAGQTDAAQLQVTLQDADLCTLLPTLEEKGVVFTLVLEGLNSQACLLDPEALTGALDEDAVALTIAGYSSELFASGKISGEYDGTNTIFHFSTIPNVDFNSAIDVPEPTTGALSLLALAGLCARRRRK